MFKKYVASLLIVIFIASSLSTACKDIIVTKDYTAGDYNLFMKVRDPSRPGLQVLCMIPKGYEYTYHSAWRGEPHVYRFTHKVIGVATKGDTPPNIFKAGMLFTDAGIAFGDADVASYLVNPTRNAWDDFDWLRYAAENASSVDEAMDLLQNVVEMHAPGVGENLFVVGYDKACVAEADAYRFIKSDVAGVLAMSNYPKMLWNGKITSRLIASSFDKVFEGSVKRWHAVRLGGVFGIRITKMAEDWIEARQVPFGEKARVDIGNGARVGNYWVELLESNGKSAKIRVSYAYYEWEKILEDKLRKGNVDVGDMMKIARLTSQDLYGLRGMSEGDEKATMIFVLPSKPYLACGWFAPDAIASIFVPVHICDYDIYDAYENGEAAEISLNLLMKYDRVNFSSVEEVFQNENAIMEELALKNEEKASFILTQSDMAMQREAFMMENMWMNLNDKEKELMAKIWQKDYYTTVSSMAGNIDRFGEYGKRMLTQIALQMCEARTNIDKEVNGSDYTWAYEKAKKLADAGKYKESLVVIKEVMGNVDEKLFGMERVKEKGGYGTLIAVLVILALLMFMIYVKRKR
ncbi:MAG: hypothetical protein J7K61_05025 [Thermoplasmata archaeon]|nr:hypothetical protein [Thermoplasmata archaeon]